jgi:hypothetical protein
MIPDPNLPAPFPEKKSCETTLLHVKTEKEAVTCKDANF